MWYDITLSIIFLLLPVYIHLKTLSVVVSISLWLQNLLKSKHWVVESIATALPWLVLWGKLKSLMRLHWEKRNLQRELYDITFSDKPRKRWSRELIWNRLLKGMKTSFNDWRTTCKEAETVMNEISSITCVILLRIVSFSVE